MKYEVASRGLCEGRRRARAIRKIIRICGKGKASGTPHATFDISAMPELRCPGNFIASTSTCRPAVATVVPARRCDLGTRDPTVTVSEPGKSGYDLWGWISTGFSGQNKGLVSILHKAGCGVISSWVFLHEEDPWSAAYVGTALFRV